MGLVIITRTERTHNHNSEIFTVYVDHMSREYLLHNHRQQMYLPGSNGKLSTNSRIVNPFVSADLQWPAEQLVVENYGNGISLCPLEDLASLLFTAEDAAQNIYMLQQYGRAGCMVSSYAALSEPIPQGGWPQTLSRGTGATTPTRCTKMTIIPRPGAALDLINLADNGGEHWVCRPKGVAVECYIDTVENGVSIRIPFNTRFLQENQNVQMRYFPNPGKCLIFSVKK